MPDPGIYDFNAIQEAMRRIRKEEGDAMGISVEQRPFSNPIDGHGQTSNSNVGGTPPPPPPNPPPPLEQDKPTYTYY